MIYGSVFIHIISFPKELTLSLSMMKLCRIHGQPKFVLHDGIAAGLFNAKYNGAGSQFGAWDKWLTNTQELVNLLLGRMKKDYESCAPRMRKPFGQSQLDPRTRHEIFSHSGDL